MSAAVDVVVVPDFSGRASVTFEARTLYLLASWLELSNVRGRFPLHLACIGEPPASVRELAKKCDASITVHAPASANLGVYANKLRGFEVDLQTDRIFLLDVDVLVMSDLGDLAEARPRDGILAAPSHSAILLPEMWEELYARLGLSLPTERIADFHLTLDLERQRSNYPSFNTGAILAPRSSRLHELWLEHLAALGPFRERWNPKLKPINMSVTDEPAFATAVHALRRDGTPIVHLPDRFNGRWRHLYRRSPSLDQFAVFHMTSSFAHGETLAEKLRPSALGYQKKLFRRYGKRWLKHSDSHARDAVRYLVPASLELLRLGPLLQRLYERHIRPVVA